MSKREAIKVHSLSSPFTPQQSPSIACAQHTLAFCQGWRIFFQHAHGNSRAQRCGRAGAQKENEQIDTPLMVVAAGARQIDDAAAAAHRQLVRVQLASRDDDETADG
jgi:hypothetical protein